MTLPTLSGTVRTILAVVVAVILVAIFFQIRSCQHDAQRDAQSRVDQGQAGAFRNSATDAMNTVSGVNANTMNAADVSRQNEEEIRHAQGSAQPVDPAANAGGLSALCRRASHAHDPACRVQQPHP